MEILNLQGGVTTPTITFDPFTGILNILGRSLPENSVEYYQPLIKLLEEYYLDPNKETQINIRLEYLNTSSTRCILDIFKKIERIHLSGATSAIINWFYEEDDPALLETGEDYKQYIKIPFNIIPESE